MRLHLGRVARLRNVFVVAATSFFAMTAYAAFYSAPKEFTFPQDNFAILTHADPDVVAQQPPAPPGRIYSFNSPAFGKGVLFSVNVTPIDAKLGRPDKDWLCLVARNGRDIVSVTQSGVTGLQLVDDKTMPGAVVAERVFINGGKIYTITAWGEDPGKPSQFAGRAEMMQEFLGSWRLLDAPKNLPLPKVGEAVSCASKPETHS